MIIDLHSHLLPGVDDGAQNLTDSIELGRLAYAEGVRHIVLTPHHLNGRYVNPAQTVIEASQKLQTDYQAAGLDLKVYPGQEIRMNSQFLEHLYNQDLLSLDGNGRYYLIEFPTASIPEYSWSLMTELVDQGIIPVIAHPERNHVFAEDLVLLSKYIELGCLGQVTTSCLSGYYGHHFQNISRKMLAKNLVHVVASDVHHIEHRPVNFKAAFDYVDKEFGSETVEYLKNNARQIINGDLVERKSVKIGKSEKKRRWFGLF